MIIKAQRAFNGKNILIYNKDRSLVQEMEDEVLSQVIGDRHKIYLDVDIDDAGMMHLKREVKANW